MTDIRPSEDDVIYDVAEYDQPVLDVDDDWHTGKPFEPTPDQAPMVELVQYVVRELTEEIKREQARLAQNDKTSIRVSTNLSGSVQFRRYSLTAAMGAVQILWEKPYRGRTIINVHSGDGLFIADEPGIMDAGPNTILLTPTDPPREIRTREELYCLVDGATEVVFDVQEEFDS